MKPIPPSPLPNLPHRRFLQGLATGGVLLGMPSFARQAWAGTSSGGSPAVLRGTEFDLMISETPVNFTHIETI